MADTAVVVGVGNGLGTALFRKFAERGMDAAILTGRPELTSDVAEDLRGDGQEALSIDCSPENPVALAQGFADVIEDYGSVDVVAFVAGDRPDAGMLDLSRGDFLDTLHRDVLGGFCTARAVVPRMQQSDGGTVLFVGGPRTLTGADETIGASSSQPGLRGLSASIGAEFEDDGVSVSHVCVDGQVDDGAGGGLDANSVAGLISDLVIPGPESIPNARSYRIDGAGKNVDIEALESRFE